MATQTLPQVRTAPKRGPGAQPLPRKVQSATWPPPLSPTARNKQLTAWGHVCMPCKGRSPLRDLSKRAGVVFFFLGLEGLVEPHLGPLDSVDPKGRSAGPPAHSERGGNRVLRARCVRAALQRRGPRAAVRGAKGQSWKMQGLSRYDCGAKKVWHAFHGISCVPVGSSHSRLQGTAPMSSVR